MFRRFFRGLAVVLISLDVSIGFTPEQLLSAPRQGSFVANKAGSLVLYRSSTHSFQDHNTTSTWSVLNLGTGVSETIDFASDAIWLGINNKTLLYTKPLDGGETELWIATYHPGGLTKYKAGAFPGPVTGVKAATVDDTAYLVFSALSNPDGSIYNPKTAPKRYTSGLVYEQLFVRHWDSYVTPEKSALFSNSLSLKDDRYTLTSSDYINLLSGDQESPVPPFGGSGDFDISSDRAIVAYVSKDPELNPATHTASYIYHVSFDGKSMPPAVINRPDGLDANGNPLAKGSSSSPIFSPDSSRIAWLQMHEDGYESDQNKMFLGKKGSIIPLLVDWDVSPSALTWSTDGEYLYIIAENNGRGKLYRVNVETEDLAELISDHSVHSVATLPAAKLLVTISSLVDSPSPFVFDTTRRSLSPLTGNSLKQLSVGSLVEDFSFPGHDDVEIHGFIVKPSFFDESKKFPLLYFIHGGPQGAWTDSWSTRWNIALFAEQGYIAIAVNPTGSTGYGQKLVDAIQGEWGSKPYEDLAKGIDYLEGNSNFSYIDFDHMVALGASYGGYMINWIQGMPLGRKFKALVCHDGVYSTLNQIASEELWFPHHDFKGPIWENREPYEKWDPAQKSHLNNWATPQMVIHNSKDYRLPISEGLSVFNILQVKGIPSKFLTFPDENHWVLNPENSLMWHEEIFEWIQRWSPSEPTAQDTILKQGQPQVIMDEL